MQRPILLIHTQDKKNKQKSTTSKSNLKTYRLNLLELFKYNIVLFLINFLFYNFYFIQTFIKTNLKKEQKIQLQIGI